MIGIRPTAYMPEASLVGKRRVASERHSSSVTRGGAGTGRPLSPLTGKLYMFFFRANGCHAVFQIAGPCCLLWEGPESVANALLLSSPKHRAADPPTAPITYNG